MSILGWMVIVFGGSFHVGDRIKIQKDGLPYVGDIIDISLLRMTVLEDITLTSYKENIRSGRIFSCRTTWFLPRSFPTTPTEQCAPFGTVFTSISRLIPITKKPCISRAKLRKICQRLHRHRAYATQFIAQPV